MSNTKGIAAIQACVSNPLDPSSIADRRIAGVIGAAPSRYSRSPALWNAAFADLSIEARYVPLDVESARLNDLAAVFRDCERLLGVNVTVPHKLAIIDFLDELDPEAARVQAVNTVVRSPDGRLVGYNTDGAGFVASILEPQPGQAKSFVASLSGADVLLLGAGGSARAVAFHVSPLLGGGKLTICNRTVEHALALAAEIRAAGYNAEAIGENELPRWAARVMLIVNSTTKGQGGAFSLEPYSALAPARPSRARQPGNGGVVFAAAEEPTDLAGIKVNNAASLALASTIPQSVGFYDLIYHPEETVFLRHGRDTGHRTMNGKAMIVCQAAIAFCTRICRAELQARELDDAETYRRVLTTMHNAW
jgi:shikimate dehydrogenase